MIYTKFGDITFKVRVAGILTRNGKVLIHKNPSDDFFALPGGRANVAEDTVHTMIRKMKEEINVDVFVDWLAGVYESFYSNNGEQFHQLTFYYRIGTDDASLYERGDTFDGHGDLSHLKYLWVSLDELDDIVFYPESIKEIIKNPLPYTKHRIEFD